MHDLARPKPGAVLAGEALVSPGKAIPPKKPSKPTRRQILAREVVPQSWFGMISSPEQDKVWWSGGGSNLLHTFDLNGTKLVRTGQQEPYPVQSTKEELDKLRKEAVQKRHFRSGLALDARGRTI